MTGLLVYIGAWTLACVLICIDEARRRRRATNLDQHIEQAIAVVDDGRALADEAEDYLKRRSAR